MVGGDLNEYFEIRLPEFQRRNRIWTYLTKYLQRRYLGNRTEILDLGAGQCVFANNLENCQVTAMDSNPNFQKFAQPGIKTILINDLKLSSYVSNRFDCVFASNFIEHIRREEIDDLVNEIKQILVPGGILILLQPNFALNQKNYFDDYTHLSIWTDKSLQDYLRANKWKIQLVKKRFLPFTMKTRLPTPLFLLKLYLHSPYKPFAGQMLIIAMKSDED